MYLRSQSSSVTSSFSPRISTIGICVWPLINPGSTILPRASIVLAAVTPLGNAIAACSPIATMLSPRTARKPPSTTRRSASIVTMVAPVISKSTDTASVDVVCAQTLAPAAARQRRTGRHRRNRRNTSESVIPGAEAGRAICCFFGCRAKQALSARPVRNDSSNAFLKLLRSFMEVSSCN